ncbi:MAG: hypothetical protein K8W52_25135 [Deltaproteobacteria bacterium]|nr:hypothetical protein [Deltaproteobacteria bacterium]
MSGAGIGILGIGVELPATVRSNDWWPAEVVASWAAARAAAPPPPPIAMTEGMALVARAMQAQGGDPFQGTTARRVIADDQTAIDLEVAAARAALARAEVAPEAIDLVLTSTTVPEYLVNNGACVLHHRLGLRHGCFAIQIEATGFATLAQLELATAMITTGRATTALLVQSTVFSRILDQRDQFSPMFGDGATALVVGKVAPGRGVQGAVHYAQTAHPFQLVASPPGKPWYADGKALLHSLDLPGARRVFLAVADEAREAVGDLLAQTGERADAIDFFASHQGTPWLRRLSQEHAGVTRARTVDTYAETASLFASNIPLVLHRAEERGMLAPDDRVVLFGGGTGVTYGATLLRWGR